MTVTTTASTVSYVGNGATTVFDFDFVIPVGALVVTIEADGVTRPVDPGAYSVVGLGQATGGSITFAVAPAVGSIITVMRSVAPTQERAFVNGQAIYAKEIEGGFDKLTMVQQQHSATLESALRFPASDGLSGELPSAVARSGRVLGFGEDGRPTVYTASSGVTVAENVTLTRPDGVGVAGSLKAILTDTLAWRVPSVAALRTQSPTAEGVFIEGYYAAGDGGGGEFVRDHQGTQGDDGGVILLDAAGQRWRRKAGWLVDLRAFGALGDDATDNTAAVQRWLNYIAAHQVTGWVGDGVYRFGHVAVTIPAGGVLSIRGSGVLKLSDPAAVFADHPEWISVSPTTSDTETLDIRDITIDGNSTKWAPGSYVTDTPYPPYNDAAPATGHWRGWFLIGSSDLAKLTIQDVTFLDWKRGVVVDSCRYVDFEDCWSDSHYTIGQVLLAADYCENVTFSNNQCRGYAYTQGAENFVLGTTSASCVLPHNSSNVTIENNTSFGHQFVCRITDLSSVSGERCSIVGNIIDFPPADTAVHGYKQAVISNNIIHRSGDVGISTDESQYVTIVGNAIDGCCAGGITLFNPVCCTVAGNAIKDIAQDYTESVIIPSLGTAVGIWITGTDYNPPNSFIQKEVSITGNSLVLTSRPPVDPVAISVGVFDDESKDFNQTVTVTGNVCTADSAVAPRFSVSAQEACCYIAASTGTPIPGEILAGGTSGVRAHYAHHTGGGSGGKLFFAEPTGPFVNGELITATTSGATFTAESSGGGANPRWSGVLVRNNIDRFRQRGGQAVGTTAAISRI